MSRDTLQSDAASMQDSENRSVTRFIRQMTQHRAKILCQIAQETGCWIKAEKAMPKVATALFRRRGSRHPEQPFEAWAMDFVHEAYERKRRRKAG